MIRVLLDANAATAATPAYRFTGAAGRTLWPMRDGVGLGPAGAWNFFWRLGFRPSLLDVTETELPSGAVLAAVLDGPPSPATRDVLRRWHAAGNAIIAAGDPAGFADFLPPGATMLRSPYPYGALAYAQEGRTEIVAPPAWPLTQWATPEVAGGRVAVIGGERQSPARALVTPFERAPALVIRERFVYLNANPFAAFQAWLQGQEPLEPWLGWRPRLFWLDEHVAALWRLLIAAMPALATLPRPGVAGLGASTVVLRHDLDSSRDTNYLDAETRRGRPASYAVLLDRNRRFWVDRLAGERAFEDCFHYNTIDRFSAVAAAIGRLLGRASHGAEASRPALREITRTGLARQVAQARAAGIGIVTLHRHGAFLVYPEWIDALDHCLAALPEILGSSSLFRGTVLRWGARAVDGSFGTIADFPDAGFPLWWPFKLAHAGQGGRLLRGWESTSVMECEPALVAQLLDHRIPELPQRMITLGYHPFHAKRATFCPDGSLRWFEEVLDLIAQRPVEVLTLREVYRRLDAP